MSLLKKLKTGTYISSLDSANSERLHSLQTRMLLYYQNLTYHREWIHGINSTWKSGQHDAQLAMCKYIPVNAAILEVGCGDGSAQNEIKQHVGNVQYVGTDLNPGLWQQGEEFLASKADELPFQSNSFDIVISMFVIEHLIFPSRFLDEAWRVLRPSGRLIIIAPDFEQNLMSSERVGLSYGSGRAKMAKQNYVDALLTAYDSRLRLTAFRRNRKKYLKQGKYNFPILTEPRCLHLPGFIPDCDAVYPVCSLEVINYFHSKLDFNFSELFYQNRSTFGLLVTKQ